MEYFSDYIIINEIHSFNISMRNDMHALLVNRDNSLPHKPLFPSFPLDQVKGSTVIRSHKWAGGCQGLRNSCHDKGGLKRDCNIALGLLVLVVELAGVVSIPSDLVNPLVFAVSGQKVSDSYLYVSSAFPLFSHASGVARCLFIWFFWFPCLSEFCLEPLINPILTTFLRTPQICDLRFSSSPLVFLMQAIGWEVLPSSNLGLHFLDSEFCFCLKYWLGVPLASDFSPSSIFFHPADPSGAWSCLGLWWQ